MAKNTAERPSTVTGESFIATCWYAWSTPPIAQLLNTLGYPLSIPAQSYAAYTVK